MVLLNFKNNQVSNLKGYIAILVIAIHVGSRDLDATCAAALEECAKMLYFSHPNVLGLIGVCLDWGPSPVIILPFMANGCLLNYLKKERENLDCEDPNETDKVTTVI